MAASADKPMENSIRQTPRRKKDVLVPLVDPTGTANELKQGKPAGNAQRAAPEPPQAPQADRRAIPDEIRGKFTQVGRKFHFPDGTLAFTDRGSRLTSPSENTEVIKTLIAIAQARGWSDITIKGTERFRRDAWFAGRLAGLEVRGYRASDYEQGRLVRALARSAEGRAGDAAAGAPPAATTPAPHKQSAPGATPHVSAAREARARREGLRTGRLAAHGAAPYRHDPARTMSYFIRLETPAGDREIWGVDLHRAFKESLTQPRIGDEVGVRSIRREAVKVWAPELDAEGQVVGEKRLETHRNAWVVEKREFFKARAQAARTFRDPRIDQQQGVKRNPELVGTYLQLHAAELAAKSIRDPEDQLRFVASVRHALADSIGRGEPLRPVRLKEPAPERTDARASAAPPPEREPTPVR